MFWAMYLKSRDEERLQNVELLTCFCATRQAPSTILSTFLQELGSSTRLFLADLQSNFAGFKTRGSRSRLAAARAFCQILFARGVATSLFRRHALLGHLGA